MNTTTNTTNDTKQKNTKPIDAAEARYRKEIAALEAKAAERREMLPELAAKVDEAERAHVATLSPKSTWAVLERARGRHTQASEEITLYQSRAAKLRSELDQYRAADLAAEREAARPASFDDEIERAADELYQAALTFVRVAEVFVRNYPHDCAVAQAKAERKLTELGLAGALPPPGFGIEHERQHPVPKVTEGELRDRLRSGLEARMRRDGVHEIAPIAWAWLAVHVSI